MKPWLPVLFLILLSPSLPLHAAPPPITNLPARAGLDLNGRWHVIVDPYENGFHNHRYEAFDASDPITGGYALDRRQTDKSELLEYSCDTNPTLLVPGD